MKLASIVPLLLVVTLAGCNGGGHLPEPLAGSEGGRADWERTDRKPAPPRPVEPAKPVAAVVAPAPPAAVTGAAAYAQHAEQFAKGAGCVRPVATLSYRTTIAETFTVVCTAGDARSIRCENGDCRELK
jgi:hypothetical protein